MVTYVSLKDEVDKFHKIFFRNILNPFMRKSQNVFQILQ